MKTKTLRKGGLFVGALAVTLGLSAFASAQTIAIPPMALNRYEPAERGSEWFANESLDFRGELRPAFGITVDYAHKGYTLLNPDGTENTVIIQNSTYLHLGVDFVWVQRLRVGLSLPIALSQNGNTKAVDTRLFIPPTQGGIGDLRATVDLRLVGEYGDPFTIVLGGHVWVPTGDDSQYIGDGKVRIGPRVALAGDIGAFVYSAGLGAVYRANKTEINGHPNGTETTFSAALGVRVADKKLVIGPEIYGTTVVAVSSAVFGDHTTPLGLILGGHYSAGAFRIGAGAGPGLSDAAGTPEFRALGALDYMPEIKKTEEPPAPSSDRDGDGVLDGEDACPDVAGVRTQDRLTNGCLADRDGDGIYDKDDACPEVPGVRTGDPKTNGCPPDRDGDGIADMDDACPDVPGMKTSDPKTNGCPSDGDGDGIYDKDDACPTVPGVKTDDPKTNGCPSDRDKDGIVDTEDACPDVPGPRSSDPKRNGCPLVYIEKDQVRITQQIKFKTNSAQIIGSDDIIAAVVSILNEHPEIKHLRVQGHTDNVGAAAYNKELSRKRAESVRMALVRAGVAKERLSSAGFGLERPLEDNSTEEGRAANRRVELHIEDTATEK